MADLQKAIETAQSRYAPAQAAGPQLVAGPGPDPDFRMEGGTRAQGYSRDYTPEQRIGINQAWIDYAHSDPKKLMEMMTQYGVTAKDLALSFGMDQNSLNQYLIRSGADPSFAGIDTGWDADKQAQFIRWQGEQTDQFGNRIGDTWAKQGITDPVNDPLLRARAQEQIEREVRRQALRSGESGGGFVPGPGGGGGTSPTPPAPPPPPPGIAPPSPTPVPPPYTAPPFTPPPVYEPPMPFTGPGGTIYPNSIQTPQGPQPTYFPTSWWTQSPSASTAYGQTAPSTAPDLNAQMAAYREKYAPKYYLPAQPQLGAPGVSGSPAAPAPSGTPDTPPAPGYIWQRNPVTSQWEQVPDPTLQAATGGAVSELWDKYHG